MAVNSSPLGAPIGFHVALTAITFIALGNGPCCAVTDPFPSGFSLPTLGAIIDARGSTGRQPWIPAAFCNDSSRFGGAFCGTSFFGPVGSPDLYRAICGGWYRHAQATVKTAFSHFNALDVYCEESGFLTIGTHLFNTIGVSVECRGTLLRAAGFPVSHRNAVGGASAWVPWSWAGVSLSVDNLPLYDRIRAGAMAPPVFRAGIHTITTRYGSQGALLTVVPSDPRPVCFTIGEAYRITRSITFTCALSNNPVLIGVGIAVTLNRTSAAIGLANHPILGWSQGVAAEYASRESLAQRIREKQAP